MIRGLLVGLAVGAVLFTLQALDEDSDYYDDDEHDCRDCHGDGWLFGEDIIGYDAFWHIPDKAYTCLNCGGSGLRRDQTVF